MYRKLIALFAVLAVLSGVAFAHSYSPKMKLKVFDGSSKDWLAVMPVDDGEATAAVEMLEATSDHWVEMPYDAEQGYFQAWSLTDAGFDLPLSFRLTSEDGEQVIMDNIITTLGAAELESAVQFRSARKNGGHHHNHNGGGHNNGGGNGTPNGDDGCDDSPSAPTQRPSSAPADPTSAPADPTSAPADPTSAPADPTSAPAQPTIAPAQPTGKATFAPTERPTSAPTKRPTSAPTQRATSAPTQRPTSAPTQRATSAPTQRPTSAPTQRPTSAPTQRATQKPSTGSSTTDPCAIVPTSQEPVKILVPLYTEPGKFWDNVVSSAKAGTSIVAILNPDNGPVTKGPPSNWVTAMGTMGDAGVDMIGYVATGYAANSITSLKSQIDTYASKYTGMKGIFLDEVSNLQKDIPFYQQLHDYIMAKPGFVHNILNPGTSTIQGYEACSTNLVIFESQASSFKAPSASWVKCSPDAASKAGYKYRFSGIAFSSSQSTMTSLVSQMANSGMGMVYITDDVLPNPYDDMPSYWTTFANTVRDL